MRGETLLITGFVALFTLILLASATLPWQSAAAPALASAFGLTVSAVSLVNHLRSEESSHPRKRPMPWAQIGGFLAICTIVLLLGFTLGGALAILWALKTQGRQRWIPALLAAGLTAATVELVFNRLLGAQLFEGALALFF